MKVFRKMSLEKRILMLAVVAVTIPSIIFCSIFFWYMEKNIIEIERNNIFHLLKRHRINITKNVDSIKTVERFFSTDTMLTEFLENYHSGILSQSEKESFSEQGLETLTRMVDNNPYLNQIRIYIPDEFSAETEPVIYNKKSMDKMEWTTKEPYTGWQIGYLDHINNNEKINNRLVGYIREIRNYKGEVLAVMEVAMLMETVFTHLSVNGDDGNVWCFIDKDENVHIHKKIKHLEGIKEVASYLTEKNDVGTYYTVIDGKSFIIGYLKVEAFRGTLISISDVSALILDIQRMMWWFIIMIIIICGIFGLAVNVITKRMLKKFYNILYSIQEMQKGNHTVVLDEEGEDEVSELGSQINKMSRQIKLLMDENVHRELLVKDAEIKALQNQINAHFIYNVLESIKMMAEIDEKYEISDAITALGRLLRYTIKWTWEPVTLKEEITYLENYLKLINLRTDYEIKLSVDLAAQVLQRKLPKMSLQPLVENAIYHGIEGQMTDTTIYVRGYIRGEEVVIEVIDVGKGMSVIELELVGKKISGEVESKNAMGIGLRNIQERIERSFGEDYGLEIASKEGYYTKVKITIPLIG